MAAVVKYPKSPIALHRFPEIITHFGYGTTITAATESTKQKDIILDSETTVAPYGDCRITNVEVKLESARGISTFGALNENEYSDAFIAAHDLFNADGERLNCYFCAESREIAGYGFAYDLNFPNLASLVRHVNITPSQSTSIEEMNCVSCCLDRSIWSVCPLAGAEPKELNYEGPDIPQYPQVASAFFLLEYLAQNVTTAAQYRRDTRIYRYCMHEMTWDELLVVDNGYLRDLVYMALKLREANKFEGLSIHQRAAMKIMLMEIDHHRSSDLEVEMQPCQATLHDLDKDK